MYPDDIVIFRAVHVEDAEGDAKRTFPSDPEPHKASVMTKQVDRLNRDGQTHTVIIHDIATPADVQLKTDDKVEWLSRKLTVEVGTIPKGLQNVTWRTRCIEAK
jgi:hypothetical protein